VRILGATGSCELRVHWVRTEGAAAAGKRRTSRCNGIGRCALLDPVDDSTQDVEVVERGTAAAVTHPGNEEDAAPLGDLVGDSVGCRKRLVVAKRIER